MIVNHTVLFEFVTSIFEKVGVSQEDAKIIADVLITADFRGVYSHGVIRVEEYIERIRLGGWPTEGNITIEKQSGSIALIDGHNGIGILTAVKGMQLAIEIAEKSGIGLVSVKGGGHFGCASYFAIMAKKRDMIGISLTNASPGIAPTGGAEPILGNNPWSVAVPGDRTQGVVLDMANSIVARGKIRFAAKNGVTIPFDWAIDQNGSPTNDAQLALKGSLLPIGGYKGYGITLIVDLLSGVLSGAAYGPHVGSPREPAQKQNVGQLFIAINIDMIQPKDEFKSRVDNYIQEIKNSKLAERSTEILIPGELEFRKEQEYQQSGLQINDSVIKSLIKVAKETGVVVPEGIFMN